MILNAPSVAAGFLTLVQAGVAASVTWRSAAAMRAVRRARTPEELDAAEIGVLRPALQAVALAGVVLASWALLIEVLSSYVPTWPSVVCIEGVTRIGTGTVGAARHLPWLLDVLFTTKPSLVLLGGAWCVAHSVLRRAGARPGRLGPALLLGLGALGLLDAVAEAAYLAIPKEERFLSSGCCLVTSLVLADPERSWLEHVVGEIPALPVIVTLGAAWFVQVSALAVMSRRRADDRPPSPAVVATALAAVVVVSVAAQHVYVAVVSPRVTGISTHRCGWCVLEKAPLGGLAAGLLAVGCATLVLAAFAAFLERRRSGAGAAVSRGGARLALALCWSAAVAAALASL